MILITIIDEILLYLRIGSYIYYLVCKSKHACNLQTCGLCLCGLRFFIGVGLRLLERRHLAVVIGGRSGGSGKVDAAVAAGPDFKLVGQGLVQRWHCICNV